MELENTKGRNFELRSEKTRSLVGEIPSVLIRYGIVIIISVLALLVGIAMYFPYRKVYHGEAVIYSLPSKLGVDSILLPLKCRFVGEIPRVVPKKSQFALSVEGRECVGRLVSLDQFRDTLGRQKALLVLPPEVALSEPAMLPFRLTIERGSIAGQLFGFVR